MERVGWVAHKPYKPGELAEEIFPKGYDPDIERWSRQIALQIGFDTLNDEEKGVIEEVRIEDIYPGQAYLSCERLVGLMVYMRKNPVPGYPSALRTGGRIYLVDGHHRVSAQILMGREKVDLHITDIPDELTNI